MSYSSQKGIVNRYWKRPKPRVYECNVRDAERFYQQSYKDYLDAKEVNRARDTRIGGIGTDNTYNLMSNRPSNSLIDNDLSRDLPSFDSTLDSTLSATSSFRNSACNSRNRTPEVETQNHEERLQRIQKLRSELGLPSPVDSSKTTFESSSFTSNGKQLFNEQLEQRGRNLDISNELSAPRARASSKNRSVEFAADTYGDRTNGVEKTSRYSSKYSTANDDFASDSTRPRYRTSSLSKDDGDKYSYKSSLKSERHYDTNNESDTYSKPRTKLSSKISAATINDNDDCDADMFLSDMKKKFPTSDEILERIKKMDAEM